MKRIYENIIKEHFALCDQMLFFAGPRQVGKTTVSLTAKRLTDNFNYISWDIKEHRQTILHGQKAVAAFAKLGVTSVHKPIIVFDEIHKYGGWKNFLKGFFDLYRKKTRIIVTGSSKLDVFKKGGDSLMGRYFPYRVHPISVAECLSDKLSDREVSAPRPLDAISFQNLFEFGGFPDPYIKANKMFAKRWRSTRYQQLFYEDIRDLTRVKELAQFEMLAEIIKNQVGQLTSYSSLANKINVSSPTVKEWLKILESVYYCFSIKPWSKNVSRSLLKEPKFYLWDWSHIYGKEGAKTENFLASHLLKAVHFWSDRGFGKYDLYFIRDKDKREVDFVVTKDNKAWFLVEVKSGNHSRIGKNLIKFHKEIGTRHAFQVIFNMDFINKNCFEYHDPVIVPVKTFLSQLV